MPTIGMNDGSNYDCTLSYAVLRALLFEKSTGAVAGVTRGPGNPATWLEFAAELLPSTGKNICINPSGVSILIP